MVPSAFNAVYRRRSYKWVLITLVLVLLGIGYDLLVNQRGGIAGTRQNVLDTGLFLALYAEDLDSAARFLEWGADVNARDALGRTLLMHAAAASLDSTRFLLDHGVDTTAVDRQEVTALCYAAGAGKTATAELLLDRGALPNGGGGPSPLAHAVWGKHHEAVKLLLGRGADVDMQEPFFLLSTLMDAVQNEDFAMMRLLADAGVDVDARDRQGWAALHRAVWKGSVDATRLLLEIGASPDIADRDGWTPLMAAVAKNRGDIVGLLVMHGASVSVATADGLTPLMKATQVQHEIIFQTLLDGGADPSRSNWDGGTALTYARLLGWENGVAELSRLGARQGQIRRIKLLQ